MGIKLPLSVSETTTLHYHFLHLPGDIWCLLPITGDWATAYLFKSSAPYSVSSHTFYTTLTVTVSAHPRDLQSEYDYFHQHTAPRRQSKRSSWVQSYLDASLLLSQYQSKWKWVNIYSVVSSYLSEINYS